VFHNKNVLKKSLVSSALKKSTSTTPAQKFLIRFFSEGFRPKIGSEIRD